MITTLRTVQGAPLTIDSAWVCGLLGQSWGTRVYLNSHAVDVDTSYPDTMRKLGWVAWLPLEDEQPE